MKKIHKVYKEKYNKKFCCRMYTAEIIQITWLYSPKKSHYEFKNDIPVTTDLDTQLKMIHCQI